MISWSLGKDPSLDPNASRYFKLNQRDRYHQKAIASSREQPTAPDLVVAQPRGTATDKKRNLEKYGNLCHI
jgi:hypothetical protein